jgi:hypothetical protein
MPDPEQLPATRLAKFLEHRGNTQALPKLAQAAQNSGFGKLPAQGFPRLGRGQRPVLFVQGLPQLEHQGRDLVARGFRWSVLPVSIGTQAEDIGQSLAGNKKIRLLPGGAKKVKCHHGAGFDQPGQQHLGRGNRVASGGCRRAPQHCFHKRRRGRRQLRAPRQVQA